MELWGDRECCEIQVNCKCVKMYCFYIYNVNGAKFCHFTHFVSTYFMTYCYTFVFYYAYPLNILNTLHECLVGQVPVIFFWVFFFRNFTVIAVILPIYEIWFFSFLHIFQINRDVPFSFLISVQILCKHLDYRNIFFWSLETYCFLQLKKIKLGRQFTIV